MAAGSIVIDLLMKTGSFVTDTARAEKSMKSFRKSTIDLKSSLLQLAPFLTIGAVASYSKSLIEAGDNMQRLSDRTGVSVQSLASLELSAKQSETNIESIANAMNKFTKSIGEAQNGSKEVAEALNRLGITTQDPVEGLIQISEALDNSNNSAKVQADIYKVLGKNAAELLPFLKQGAASIREQVASQLEYSKTMADFAPKADKFQGQMDAIALATKKASIEFLQSTGIMDGLSRATKFLSENMEKSITAITAFGIALGLALSPVKTILGITAGSVANLYLELTKTQSAEAKIENLKKKIIELNNQLNSGTKQIRTDKGLQNLVISDAEKASIIKQRESLVKQIEALQPKKVADVKDNALPTIDPEAEKKLQDYITKLTSLFGELQNLNPEEKTNIQLLQEKIDALTETSNSLDSANAKYVAYAQNLLNAARAMESLTAFQDAFNKGIDNEIDAQNTAYEAEQERIKKQEESYQDLYDSLKKANEDLNVDLIQNDEKRVLAQIELEHKRAVEAINSKAYEYEQWKDLMDLEDERYNKSIEKAKQTTDEITEFWKQAARNMQDAMSNFFFDIMQGKLGDLASNFKATIDRMVANLLASRLMDFLFGKDFGKSGDLGGWIGKTFGGLFGGLFGGARANGGPVTSGMTYLVGEQGPELFTPNTSGSILTSAQTNAAGGVSVVNNFAITGNMDTRTQQQIAALAYSSTLRAARRNN